MKSFFTVVLLVIAPFVTISQVVDETRVEGKSGSDIVEAVVSLIRDLCIFPDDRLFLRRLAYVESADGTDPKTYRPGYDGGIWQVDEDKFKQTQAATQLLAEKYKEINQKLAIQWQIVQWSDLRKPLYSGLAAALYTMMSVNSTGVPRTVENQAAFWVAKLRPTQSEHEFFSKTEKLEQSCSSTEQIDLVFVVDSSSSLAHDDFATAKQFMADIVNGFDIAPDKTHIAVVKFSNLPNAEFFLNSYFTKKQVQDAIGTIQYKAGGTETADAIDFAMNKIFATSHGARTGIPRIIILITDGRSQHPMQTIAAADKAKKKGVNIFAVGVGSEVQLGELQKVVTPPSCTHVILTKSYNDLVSIRSEIQQVSCKAPAVLPLGNFTYSCGVDSLVQVLGNPNGTTITVYSDRGKVDVFGSLSSNPPSAVRNDFHSEASPGIPVVFYIADNRSVFIAVNGSRGDKCDVSYMITVESGDQIKPNTHVICIENGKIRPCSAKDLVHSPFTVLRNPDKYGHHPCSGDHEEFFPHPYMGDRFLYCDPFGHLYVVLCPFGEHYEADKIACVPGMPTSIQPPTESTAPPTTAAPTVIYHPCTNQAIENKQFYHPFPGNRSKYIECSIVPGIAYIKDCPRHHYWDQFYLNCLYSEVVVNVTKMVFNKNETNPCIQGGTMFTLRFFSHPRDIHKFIHCDEFGEAFEVWCKHGEIWNEGVLTCVPGPNNIVG